MTEIIVIDGQAYEKFIRYPAEVTDGTHRCIRCGQIDEDEYHDDELCRKAMDTPTPATPAVPEPVAYTDATELEAVKNGNGLMWPSPISAHWEPYDETALYSEAQMQALADRLAECEKERDSWERYAIARDSELEHQMDRTRTAEAALAEARNDALERAAEVARKGCLVPPDGGSPTEAEADLCENIATYIRALKQETNNADR